MPLETRWATLWERLSAAGDLPVVWQRLHAAYTEPHRRYHTLAHLEHCLLEFDAARELAQDPLAVEYALWFHDLHYDTHASDNEERSASEADAVLSRAGWPEERRARVRQMILDTKHAAIPASPDGTLMADVDLSILGQPRTRFEAYEREIREEYAWVPGVLFRLIRRAILGQFLR